MFHKEIYKFRHRNLHRAETLLEVIISLGVLMITLGYSGSLIASATSQIASNQNHIIASNLAKEGIEVVRNIIGTNLFRLKSDIENCWNAGFVGGAQITHVEDCTANKLGGDASLAEGYFRLIFNPENGRFYLEEDVNLEGASLDADSISTDLLLTCSNVGEICITGGRGDVALSAFALRKFTPSSGPVLYLTASSSSSLSAPSLTSSPFSRIIEIKYNDLNSDAVFDVMQVISHVFFRQSGEFREVRFGTLITPFEI